MCVCVHRVHAWCPWSSELGIRSPTIEVMDGHDPSRDDVNYLGPMLVQQVLLTSEL